MPQHVISSDAVQQSIWQALPLSPEQRLSLLEIMKEQRAQSLEQNPATLPNENPEKKEERPSKVP